MQYTGTHRTGTFFVDQKQIVEKKHGKNFLPGGANATKMTAEIAKHFP